MAGASAVTPMTYAPGASAPAASADATIARSLRRSRFRVTAVPTPRPIAYATRARVARS